MNVGTPRPVGFVAPVTVATPFTVTVLVVGSHVGLPMLFQYETVSRGVMVLGAAGTGKTKSCLLPIADQVFAYEAHDRSKRAGGIVLEVKMDFCRQVAEVLRTNGREDDYLEIGYGSGGPLLHACDEVG